MPSDIASFRVYCSDAQGNRVPTDRADIAAGPGIRLYVAVGDRITCDWYNIPARQEGARASVTIIEHDTAGRPAYVPREIIIELTIEPATDPVALFVNLPILGTE